MGDKTDRHTCGNKWKKLFSGTLLLALIVGAHLPALAQVRVDVSIPLPPPLLFPAPPELIVVPETYVYVVPDVDVDIFFYGGWWWRLWDGRWYRSRYYDRGWSHYRRVPSFYSRVPPRWRDDYRERRWRGHTWNHKRIPHDQVRRNWRDWERRKHWERQQTWGVEGLRRRPPPRPSREVKPRQPPPPPREMRPERPRNRQEQQDRRGRGRDERHDRN